MSHEGIRTVVRSSEVPVGKAPYSHAVVAGDLVYTCGCIGLDPATNELIQGGVKPEAEQALKNLKNILKASGSDVDKVLKVNVYLEDLADFTLLNEIYTKVFSDPANYPARTAIQVLKIPRNGKIEIEAVATKVSGTGVRTVVKSPDVPAGRAPYSHGVMADDLIYTCGCVGLDPATNQLIPGGVVPETEQALKNLKNILKAAGSDVSKVLKVNVFLADFADFATVNEIYKTVFSDSENYPARTCLQIGKIPLNGRVEIEAVAVKISDKTVRTVVKSPDVSLPSDKVPYSHGVMTNDLVYTCGCVGLDPVKYELVPGGVVPETEQALKNLKNILKAAGSDIDKLLKVNIYMADFSEFNAVNEIYQKVFHDPANYPARTALQVGKIPMNGRIEIEAVAMRGNVRAGKQSDL